MRRADGSKWLALAYQAADVAYEGSRGQHLRFALSKDGGETFTPSRAVMWGAVPLWSPSLHHDPGEGGVQSCGGLQHHAAAVRAAACRRQAGRSGVPVELVSVGASRLGLPMPVGRHGLTPATCPPTCPPVPVATNRLFLFYSESRKSLSPGGDIKVRTQQALRWSRQLTARNWRLLHRLLPSRRSGSEAGAVEEAREGTHHYPPTRRSKAGHCV